MPVSCNLRRTLWIEHYRLVLFLPGRAPPAAEFVDPRVPKLLRLDMLSKALMPAAIPEKWRPPLQRHLDSSTNARIAEGYRRLRAGDRVVLAYSPGEGAALRVNGGLVARAPGHDLLASLLATWAEDDPTREKLRGAIARNPCPPGERR